MSIIITPTESTKLMEKIGMDNWADIEFSSIHNILEQLETIKLVQSNIKAENGGQTSRKVYYITMKVNWS